MRRQGAAKTCCNHLNCLYTLLLSSFKKTNNYKNYNYTKQIMRKNSPNLQFFVLNKLTYGILDEWMDRWIDSLMVTEWLNGCIDGWLK